MCGMMSDLWLASIDKIMVIRDTESPNWDQVLLNNAVQMILGTLGDDI